MRGTDLEEITSRPGNSIIITNLKGKKTIKRDILHKRKGWRIDKEERKGITGKNYKKFKFLEKKKEKPL